MYTPDHGFMKDLKNMDRRLGVRFEPNIDRFVITYKRPVGEAVPLMRVETESGGFRQPDRRELLALSDPMSDRSKLKPSHQLAAMARASESYNEKRRRQSKEYFREAAIDNYNQLRPLTERIHGNPKAGRGIFRKIKPKPSKNLVTIKDKRRVE